MNFAPGQCTAMEGDGRPLRRRACDRLVPSSRPSGIYQPGCDSSGQLPTLPVTAGVGGLPITTPRERLMTLLPTSLVGSMPQPDWLIDRVALAGRFPPRTRMEQLWRVAPDFRVQAMDD